MGFKELIRGQGRWGMDPRFSIELWDIRIYSELVPIAHTLLGLPLTWIIYFLWFSCIQTNSACAVLGWHYLSMRGIVIKIVFLVNMLVCARLGHCDYYIIRKSRINKTHIVVIECFLLKIVDGGFPIFSRSPDSSIKYKD